MSFSREPTVRMVKSMSNVKLSDPKHPHHKDFHGGKHEKAKAKAKAKDEAAPQVAGSSSHVADSSLALPQAAADSTPAPSEEPPPAHDESAERSARDAGVEKCLRMIQGAQARSDAHVHGLVLGLRTLVKEAVRSAVADMQRTQSTENELLRAQLHELRQQNERLRGAGTAPAPAVEPAAGPAAVAPTSGAPPSQRGAGTAPAPAVEPAAAPAAVAPTSGSPPTPADSSTAPQPERVSTRQTPREVAAAAVSAALAQPALAQQRREWGTALSQGTALVDAALHRSSGARPRGLVRSFTQSIKR